MRSRIISVAILLAIGGCARHTTPLVPAAELTADEQKFQAVWDAGSEVLKSYRFDINKTNRRAGLITTSPMASRHFFEFWRRDVVTASGALENSVQPMYREVAVRIRKTGEGKYAPVVTVTASRLLTATGGFYRSGREPYEKVKAPTREERLIMSEGSSDGSLKDSDKHSPGDDMLAEKLAEDIRTLAAKKRKGF